jgi:hypothetical protein
MVLALSKTVTSLVNEKYENVFMGKSNTMTNRCRKQTGK